ncbi:hypothetical protein Pcinc_042278 [Petrolisthes cinctipes]|uniref:tRNA-dihydrouridine(47) synthase [NAD(P)(+)] n=1 Tax=Petrolisthes cinctipes TaxID=88211 RepID=A0AAE1EH58_PETCI|nr:hypothetical protein Pcinc_042278 [Petrolisthes cinctipes]
MSHIDLNDVVAHIKPEYIIEIEKPCESKQNNTTTNDNGTTEPPTKKQKLTGTNKHRPKYQHIPKSSKLCRSVWCVSPQQQQQQQSEEQEQELQHDEKEEKPQQPPAPPPPRRCSFPSCAFMHDVSAFLATKPPDLGPRCHNFHTFGRCPYGVVCRYGGEHISDGGNIVNNTIQQQQQQQQVSINTLSKELQIKLRKRQYDFSRAHTCHQRAMREVEALRMEREKEQEREKEGKRENVKEGITSNEKIEQKTETENGVKEREGEIEESEGKKREETVESGGKEREETVENGGKEREETVESGGKERTVKERIGPAPEEDLVKLLSREKKKISWHGKTYLAPLTTLGNLPFRRVCKRFGADITCGEMALSSCLLQGNPSEWALVKRHPTEDLFGVQVCGSSAQSMVKVTQLLEENIDFDFLDINMGCPIDLVYKQGGGSALMRRVGCLETMVRGMTQTLSRPLTLKMRTAIHQNTHTAHTIIRKAKLWDVDMVTVHGRSREQRYLKLADWDYIGQCVREADPMPVFGNGDVLSFQDYNSFQERSGVAGVMIGRGALIKPWVFREVKEQRHWDISASERLDMLKLFVNYGLEHWGSDTEGVEKTRRFLLEWLSFLHRYIPHGLLESTQHLNQRPPPYQARSDLETIMASRAASDWVKISEMLLGKTPAEFKFLPKHKANAY